MRNLGWMALAVAFSLIWSSAFMAAKLAVGRFDPASALTLRFALSAILLAPFAFREPSWRLARLGFGLGMLNNTIYLGLSFTAISLLRPAVVVAMSSCAPFMTAALAGMLGIERVGARQLAGAVIGLAGVLVVTGVDASTVDPRGVALAALGTLSFSGATLLIRARARGLSPTGLNFWQSIAGGVGLAPFAWLLGRGFVPSAPLTLLDPAVLSILYLGIIVTIGGMAMWLALIRLGGAARASAVHLMNPFFGALLSALILGSPLRGADFIGAGIIAVGLALSLSAR